MLVLRLLRSPGLEISNHIGGPIPINFAWRVIPFPKLLMAPGIPHPSFFGFDDDLFRQVWWYEDNPFSSSKHDIPGNTCSLKPYTHRNVDAEQRHICDGCWIDTPYLGRHG